MRFISITDLVIVAIGIIILLFWFILYFMGKKKADWFADLDDTDYPMHELYFVGDAFINLFKLQFKGKNDRERRKQIALIYGDVYYEGDAKYNEKLDEIIKAYLIASYSQQWTMALTVLTFAMPVYCFTNSLLFFGMVVALAIFAYYYYGTVLKGILDKRNDQLMDDFANVASKIALMVNAGMTVNQAWMIVANSGNSTIYRQMKICLDEQLNGKPEKDSYFAFGQRCSLQEIKKFASTIIQAQERDSSNLPHLLTEQSKETWHTRQQYFKRKGEAANSALLLPMIMIFIGIMIMVVVPIFNSIG